MFEEIGVFRQEIYKVYFFYTSGVKVLRTTKKVRHGINLTLSVKAQM